MSKWTKIPPTVSKVNDRRILTKTAPIIWWRYAEDDIPSIMELYLRYGKVYSEIGGHSGPIELLGGEWGDWILYPNEIDDVKEDAYCEGWDAHERAEE